MKTIDHCINHNRFISIDIEELSALTLIGKVVDKTNEVVIDHNRLDEEVKANEQDIEEKIKDTNEKKVSHDQMKTMYKHNGGDFVGSWFGVKHPVLSEPGIQGQVIKNIEDIQKLQWANDNTIFHIEEFQLMNVETENGRLKRAINTIPNGSTLLFSSKEYIFSSEMMIINKSINLIGAKKPVMNLSGDMLSGTVFTNLGIQLEANNINIEKIGFEGQLISNVIQGNTKAIESIRIRDCIVKANAHAYLFESYKGTVRDVKVENCISFGGIHGFVSKALDVKFVNCEAYNHRSFGFASISDNIPLASEKAISRNNKIIDCYAYGCGTGFVTYSRDCYSTSNTNNIQLTDLNISNCYAFDCNYSYVLGDTENAPSGQTYNKVRNVSMNGCKDVAKIDGKSIAFGRTQNCTILDFTSSRDCMYLTDLKPDVLVIGQTPTTNTSFPRGYQVFETVPNGHVFYHSTQDNATITLKHPSYMEIGKLETNLTGTTKVRIIIGDENVALKNIPNLINLSKTYMGKGTMVALERYNNQWYEVYSVDKKI